MPATHWQWHSSAKAALFAVTGIAGWILNAGHLAALQPTSATSHPPIDGQAKVLDADTLLLNNQEIQLFGIIAPDPTTPVGRSARTWLGEQIQSATVHCEPLSAPGLRPIVARCWRGGADISAELLRGGFALTDPALVAGAAGQEDLLTKYELAEREARFVRAGLWSDEPITVPSQLKDWQTLIAGLFAIIAAWMALHGINKQIAAAQNTEAGRLSAEKAALARALSAELQSMLTYIEEQRKALLQLDRAVLPSRLAQAIPSAFPLFNAAASRLGLLEADPTIKVFNAYYAFGNFAKEVEIMQTGDPDAGIAVVEEEWPAKAMDECIRCARDALDALKTPA